LGRKYGIGNSKTSKYCEGVEGKRKGDMAGVPAPEYEVYWQNESEALRAAYKEVMASHPQAKAVVVKVY
jgi:hypothetical protein